MMIMSIKSIFKMVTITIDVILVIRDLLIVF